MRTRRTVMLAATALAATWLASSASAQEARVEDLRIESVDARDFPTVVAVVTPPVDLYGYQPAPEDLTVREDGRLRPAEARILTDQPLSVLLMIDTSGSMRGEALAGAQEAASQFVEQMPPTTEFSVLGFATAPQVVSEFTTDRAEALAAIGSLEATGETALYDAVIAALDRFDPLSPSRRFVVVLSDGGDTVSTQSLEQATVELEASGIGFYAVSLQTEEFDTAPLEALAEVTAGRVVPAENSAELREVYDQIADELVNQLAIEYVSASGGVVDLSVSITGNGVTAFASALVELPEQATPTTTTTTTTTTSTTTTTVPENTTAEDEDKAATAIPNASPPVPFLGSGPGFFGSSTIVIVAALLFFVAVALALAASLFPHEERRSVLGARRNERDSSRGDELGGLITKLANRAQSAAERLVRRSGRGSGIARALDAAGVHLSPGEFVVLSASVALAGFAAGLVFGGLMLGLFFGLVAIFIPRVLLANLAERRRNLFAEQLEGTIQLLAGSLRAGYGLVQSIATVAEEAASPTSDEFRRVVIETRLGRDLVDSMTAVAERMQSQDFRWIVQAVDIQRTVGGDLSEVLDTAATTIRERNQIRRQIKALSAEGRLSAYILVALPFVLGLILSTAAPGFLSPLIEEPVGRIMLVGGAVLILAGIVWIRRIVKLVF